MVRIEGETVVLRPFEAEEVDPTVRAWTTFTGSVLPPGTVNPERLRKRLTRSGRFWRGFLDLAIQADGRVIGELQVRRRPAQTLPPGAVELGILIHDAGDRGRGTGSEAVALLVEWLFERGEAERVQLSTDVANAAMRRVAEKLGFDLEGVLRGFMPTAHGRADYVMYALTKGDWESRRQ
jgi:RimJ/RimL family protein N-acetyltransferase